MGEGSLEKNCFGFYTIGVDNIWSNEKRASIHLFVRGREELDIEDYFTYDRRWLYKGAYERPVKELGRGIKFGYDGVIVYSLNDVGWTVGQKLESLKQIEDSGMYAYFVLEGIEMRVEKGGEFSQNYIVVKSLLEKELEYSKKRTEEVELEAHICDLTNYRPRRGKDVLLHVVDYLDMKRNYPELRTFFMQGYGDEDIAHMCELSKGKVKAMRKIYKHRGYI